MSRPRKSYPVSAVWLRREGNAMAVSVEIGGKWYQVIVDHATYPSHIFELRNFSWKELQPMQDRIQPEPGQGGVI